jgi:hypothetical protein
MTPWTEISKRRGGYVLSELNTLFGLQGGRLASQLLYYGTQSKAGKTRAWIERDGQQWVGRSRQEWCEETGLSERSLRTAMKRLADEGLLHKAIYQNSRGKPVTHLRIDVLAVIERIIEKDIKEELMAALGTAATGHNAQMDSGITTTCLIKRKDLKEDSLVAEKPATEIQTPPPLVMLSGQNENEAEATPSDVAMTNLVEVLKRLTEKKKQGKPLQFTWLNEMSALTGVRQLSMSRLEQRWLKDIQADIGEEKTRECMLFALSDWGTFIWECKIRKSVAEPPTQPTLKFFRNHYPILLQLIAEQKEKHGAPPNIPTSLKPIKSGTVPQASNNPIKELVAHPPDLASEAQQQTALEQMMALVKSKG